VLKLDVRNRLALAGVAAAAAVLALLFGWMTPAAGVQAQDASGAMSIAIDGSGVDCDGDECIVDNGSDFTLTVTIDESPSDGYIGLLTQVDYQNLIYTATEDKEDEMLINMDGFPGISVRVDRGTGVHQLTAVSHGQTTGTTPPFTPSHYSGPAIQIALTCTDDYSRNEVELAPYSAANSSDPNLLGTGFKLPVIGGVSVNVPASDSLLVHCGVPPTATPVPPDATGTPPPVLPPVGTGMAGSDGDSSTGLWIVIGSLLAAGAAAGAGALVWKRARS